MIKKIAYKIAYILLVIWGVASLVFVLFSILPGDPSRMMMGQRENEEMRLAIQQKYGFDQPIHKQYFYYLNDLSPVSLHSNNTNDFTNTKNHMYYIFFTCYIYYMYIIYVKFIIYIVCTICTLYILYLY